MSTSTKAAWSRLREEGKRLGGLTLRALFADDPERFEALSVGFEDLLVDLSKEKLDRQVMSALLELARASELEGKRDAMLSGEPINLTEGRAVLHAALRGEAALRGSAREVVPDVRSTLDRFLGFAEDVREGRIAAADDRPFTDVINIGIGGSDLGPAMAVRALAPGLSGPRIHFVSNVDGAHLSDTLRDLDPARTLVVVASKTFTTLETMANAGVARAWLVDALGEAESGRHLAAVSTNLEATASFGVEDSRVFGFWDWVGGRYSLWSAIGLPIALAIGAEGFRALLAGAAAMDRHFAEAPLERNIPVLLALVGLWRRSIMGWPSVALIPYEQRLERFPAFVQQLDMESNGKRVMRDGRPLEGPSGPIVWGEPGTNAQHSFFQLLHQGTDIVPVDFIASAKPVEALGNQHALLLANCFAQSQALAFGRSEAEVRSEMAEKGLAAAEIERLAAHRTFPGDRPSTTILQERLSPYALGRLVALFEHKVFVQGAIWEINSFDQWGVELGKALAKDLVPLLEGNDEGGSQDPSTRGLLAQVKALGGP